MFVLVVRNLQVTVV